jgi:hypothetical protein
MKNKTLQEIKESIKLVNTNKKESALANKERLTSRMNNETDVNEKSRLQGLIDLQTNEIARIDAITDNEVDTLAQERFSKQAELPQTPSV